MRSGVFFYGKNLKKKKKNMTEIFLQDFIVLTVCISVHFRYIYSTNFLFVVRAMLGL